MIIANIFLIFFLIFFLIKQFKQMKKAYFSGFKETEGIVVDRKANYDSDSVTYASIIEFHVNGQPYRYVEKVQSSLTEKIGKKIKIKYNPNDPTDCVKKHNFDYVIFIIVITFFLVIINMAAISGN